MKNNQYENGKNLNTRIKLHEQYSENKQNFHQWVFSKLHLKEGMKVLECGCGPGALWYNNKIPTAEELKMVAELWQKKHKGDIFNLGYFKQNGRFDIKLLNL